MNILRMCFDWRVIAALAAVGVGVFVVAPGLILAALPLLLLAACPLSMMLMMKSMGGHEMPAAEAPPSDGRDRVGTLRAELAELRTRHDRLAGELAAIEARDGDASSDAPQGAALPGARVP